MTRFMRASAVVVGRGSVVAIAAFLVIISSFRGGLLSFSGPATGACP